MSNTVSKTKIEAYGQAVDKLHQVEGSFSAFLMLHSRLATVIAARPEIGEMLGDRPADQVGLLIEHYYELMVIHDSHRPDRDLDDGELNHARLIMQKM